MWPKVGRAAHRAAMRGNAALAAPFTVRVAYEGHALKGTHDTTEINMGSFFFKKMGTHDPAEIHTGSNFLGGRRGTRCHLTRCPHIVTHNS